jgi:hypothetical protein
MAQQPDWAEWIKFTSRYRVRDLITDRSVLPDYGGFYVWSSHMNSLRSGSVLYVGMTGKMGFRRRFRDYVDPLAKPKHPGAVMLRDYYTTKSNPEKLWVHIAPFESDKETVEMLEASMMQYFNAWFNQRSMKVDTDFDSVFIKGDGPISAFKKG